MPKSIRIILGRVLKIIQKSQMNDLVAFVKGVDLILRKSSSCRFTRENKASSEYSTCIVSTSEQVQQSKLAVKK